MFNIFFKCFILKPPFSLSPDYEAGTLVKLSNPSIWHFFMFSQQGDHLHPNLANCETSYPITVERKTDWPIPLSSVAGSALPTYPANPVYPVYQPLYNFPARSLPPPHIYPASGLPLLSPF